MSLPEFINIDIDKRAADINVPILRQPKFMALLKAFLSSTLRLQDNITSDQLANTIYSAWNSATAYAIGDRVNGINLDTKTYECIQPCTNIPTTNKNYWYVVSTDNIGISEKLSYNCQKMQLEYILNKRFNNVSSIYPPYNQPAGNIFIVTNKSYPRILWSARGTNAGGFTTPSLASKHWFCPEKVGLHNALSTSNYTIWVPNTVVTNLGYGFTDLKSLITQEVNKYNAVGLNYDFQPPY
ncbi:MAG TPA: hypothetical protein VN698_04830 [Bacteroidia bacterium]|nr:hypothetical protein [Bacteroidia bacterium]